MKREIGTYGLSPNGLTDDEVMALFNEEFGELSAISYFEFIQWELANASIHPFDDPLLVRRDSVRDFIDGKLAIKNKEVH